MNSTKSVFHYFLFSIFLVLAHIQANGSEKRILTYELKDQINSVSWYDTQRAFESASQDSIDAILIFMNTYGGKVKDADSIRSKILRSTIPVYIFIDNNAASAGAIISLACDSIYMTSSGSIGAATVVGLTGEAMPDKYQSYQRATMRATAEAKGKIKDKDGAMVWRRSPIIAEAMVDEEIVIPGLSKKGKVLTFTAAEALEHRYCDAIVESPTELYSRLGVEPSDVKSYQYSLSDRFVRFFVSSYIPGILVVVLLIGLFSGLKMPGAISPFGILILAGALFFIPLHIFGVAAFWEIMLFGVGVILLFLEIFVIPGFGFTGVSGITCVLTSLVLALIDNDIFNFEGVEEATISSAMSIVLVALVVAIIAMFFIGHQISMKNSPLFKKLGLHSAVDGVSQSESYSESMQSVMGQEGVVFSDLRPIGKVKVNGILYEASTILGYLPKGTMVVVVEKEMGQLIVEKIEEN
ncbi:nodulation protein NfeD [Halosquirtibacter laminarini]|uniref:Nodulation protein NfeD n=1 Tax=Halosquirtibacter laminarini TaxID=3374600 RepID=A0AC61NFR2_9BACT|nr:nodulation protein NfeD [Prolixibacteraceae bacterium]